MLRIYTTRRMNLRKLADFYESDLALASWLVVTPAYICQLIGPNPTRYISEKTARIFEDRLSLRTGFLDEVHA